jgi:hypothetical protein
MKTTHIKKGHYTLNKKQRYYPSEAKQLCLKKYGQKCFYCGDELTQKEVTFDHFLSVGFGDASVSNLVPACRSCNSMKNNRSLTDFIRHVMTKISNACDHVCCCEKQYGRPTQKTINAEKRKIRHLQNILNTLLQFVDIQEET